MDENQRNHQNLSPKTRALLASIPFIASLIAPATTDASETTDSTLPAESTDALQSLSVWRTLVEFRNDVLAEADLQQSMFLDPERSSHLLEQRLLKRLRSSGFKDSESAREIEHVTSILRELSTLTPDQRLQVLNLVSKTPTVRQCVLALVCAVAVANAVKIANAVQAVNALAHANLNANANAQVNVNVNTSGGGGGGGGDGPGDFNWDCWLSECVIDPDVMEDVTFKKAMDEAGLRPERRRTLIRRAVSDSLSNRSSSDETSRTAPIRYPYRDGVLEVEGKLDSNSRAFKVERVRMRKP